MAHGIPNRYDISDDGIGLLIMTAPDGVTENVALFDLADLPLVQDIRWMLNDRSYVTGRRGSPRTKLHIYKLHRLVLGLVPGDRLVGDHINGDRLDNRRRNLRAVTNQRNVAHQAVINSRGASRFRGVTWDSDRRRWHAQANVDGRRRGIGRYATEAEAAAAVAQFRAEHGLPSGY